MLNINRYQELFNKRQQNFRLQKEKPALILAKKHDNFVLPAPSGFGMDSQKNFYFSHMYNCIYDCRYCFLQGMYSSANYLLFVNFEDFFRSISETIQNNAGSSLTFFSGYDCDSLALENVTHFMGFILPLFKKHPNALLELRTKSVQLQPMISTTALQNCVIAYSLIPEAISKSLDNKTPSIQRRIGAMKTLSQAGWKLGLRFDPLIHGRDWRILYRDLIKDIFKEIPVHSIHSISFGALRFPKAMFKKIHSLYPDEKLFSGPLSQSDGLVSYRNDIENEMVNFCRECVNEFVSEPIIFNCSFEPSKLKETAL